MAKTFLTNLQASLQSSYANNGKTTVLGRAAQKTLNSQQVIGPALTNFIDVFTQTGLSPIMSHYAATQNRLYVLAGASPNPSVLMYNFNATTGAYSYVGRVILNLPNVSATTHTFRGFKVYDNGTVIHAVVGTTGSIVINGGLNVAWSLTAADFTISGTNIYPASGNNQKAMYFVQGAFNFGANNAITTLGGVALPQASASSGVNTKVWAQNGAAAAPSLFAFDLATNPTAAGLVTNGVNAQTTAYTNTSPAAFFQMSALNGYQVITSTAALFEAIVLMAGTGAVPTGFTAWTPGTVQTTGGPGYFMRDLQKQFTLTVTALTGTITAGATITSNGVAFIAASAYSAGATSIVVTTPNPWNGTSIPVNGSAPVSAGTQGSVTITGVATGNVFFNLATTGAGAAVTPTGASTSFSMVRAGGVTINQYSLQTGALPALAGTLLQNNSFQYAKPVSAPANTNLNGQDCFALATTTNVYIGKISDLTSFGTTWASQTAIALANVPGVVAPTALAAVYSGKNHASDIDKWVVLSNVSSFLAFPHQSSVLTASFGGVTTTTLEAANPVTTQFGAAAIGSIDTVAGWCFAISTTALQRGVLFLDMNSDATFGNCAVISPVQSVPAGSVLKYINALEQYFDFTDSMSFWIRNGSTSTDAAFASANVPTPSNNNGWTLLSTAKDMSAVAVGPYSQFCVTFQIMSLLANTPAQINDIEYTVLLPGESADELEIDVDSTTVGTNTPSYVAWQVVAVPSVIPSNIYVKGYDLSGNVISGVTDNFTANPSKFSYSTDGGTSWNTISSLASVFVVGNKVRYNVTSPPGSTAQMSLRYAA